MILPKALIIARTNAWMSHRVEVHMMRCLVEQGVDIQVVTNERSRHAISLEQAGIKVHYIHPASKISIGGILKLRALIKKEKFNILHLFNSRAISNGIWAAMGLKVKVVTYRGSGDLHWYDPSAYLSHLHPRVDQISCLSHYVKEQVDMQFPGRRKKTQVHYKAFLPEWFENVRPANLSQLNIPEGAVVAACAANYRKVKGIEYLIQSTRFLAHHSHFHLLLLGSGMDIPRIQKLVQDSPMKERIHFSGYRDDIYECIKACDMYVQPSLKEGLSKSVIEAMAQQIPCIASKVGGLPELVIHNKTGLLVPAKNPEKLAMAIDQLITDLELRISLGHQAKKSLFERFSMDHYVAGIRQMYSQILNAGDY